MVDRRKYVSTGIAARELGCSDRYVRLRCERGLIPGAFKLAGEDEDRRHWRIPRAWVEALVAATRPVRR